MPINAGDEKPGRLKKVGTYKGKEKTMEEQIVRINLDQLIPHPGNRRVGGFDQAKLEQLAESIRAVGVQQPAIVRPGGERICPDPIQIYELVAGERRWRASKLAGVSDLPCVIRDLDDITVLKISTIENLQREDVHPLDEADGYQRLIETAGYTIEQVAGELGKSISYVYQRLKLRDLIPEARQLFVDGKITAGHAILIARLVPGQQKEVLKKGLVRGWNENSEVVSVRALGEYIQEEVFLNLSLASWRKDDAELVLAAGACTACLKRSGAQPDLFADVCTEGKKDYCLDRTCFKNKATAMVTQRRKELEGTKYFEAVSDYLDEEVPEAVAGQYQWRECKKGDKDAQRVLVVAGTGKGRLTWGKKGQSYSGKSSGPTESAEAREKRLATERRAKEKKEKNELIRRRIYEAVVKTVNTRRIQTLQSQGLLVHILKFVAEEIIGCDNNTDELAKIEGWLPKDFQGWVNNDKYIKPRLRKLDDDHAVLLFILKLAMAEHLSEYNELKPLVALATAVGVDVKALTKEAATELRVRAAKTREEAAAPAGKDLPGGLSAKKGKKR